MLVLSRKPSERILIGEDVAITICEIRPNSVRLGIEAPQGVNIVREELRLRRLEAEAAEPPHQDEGTLAGTW